MAAGGWNWLVRSASWLGRRLRQWWRYAIALGIIVVAVIASLMNWFTVCEVVRSSTDGTTTTCAPPDLTQASVLAVVALVLALLWPDLHEITAFGVTIKKLVRTVDAVDLTTSRVDATTRGIAETADETKAGVEGIEQTLAAHGARLEEVVGELDRVSAGIARLRNRSSSPGPGERPEAGRIDVRVADVLGVRLAGVVGEVEARLGRLIESVAAAEVDLEDVERFAQVGLLLDLWRGVGGLLGGLDRARPSGDPVEDLVGDVGQLVQAIADGDDRVHPRDLRAAIVLLLWLRGG